MGGGITSAKRCRRGLHKVSVERLARGRTARDGGSISYTGIARWIVQSLRAFIWNSAFGKGFDHILDILEGKLSWNITESGMISSSGHFILNTCKFPQHRLVAIPVHFAEEEAI